MPFLLLTIVALLFSSSRAVAQTAGDAYLDAAAAEHVRLARERRLTADVSIESYKALSKERLSLGMRGLRRERLVYRREVAGRLEWTRSGPARIEVLGARELVPVAIKGVQLPSDLTSFMPHLAFDPADARMMLGWSDDSFVRHPLGPEAEADYRYRTGATTSIQLQDGRVIRLVELEIIPRRPDPQLINGSFWLEAETHAVVQASFRLARKLDILRDLEEDEDEADMPAWLGNVTAELDYVTIDYGFYDLRWWMPRLVAFEGQVRAGPLRLPLRYERTYSDYEISGTPAIVAMPMAELLERDSVRRAQEELCHGRMVVRVGNDASPDTMQPSTSGSCGRWTVVMSTDTAALLSSELLPDDPFEEGEQLLTEKDLQDLKERLGDLQGPPMLRQPELRVSFLDPTMLRYNRIEGLSVGSSASADFGRYVASANLRLGLADLEPNFELNASKLGPATTLSLGAYRRLNAADPFARPYTIGSSLSALLFGRDDTDFYRSIGLELRGEPAGARDRWYAWRIYAQRESSAAVETQFSVRNLLKDEHRFRPNVTADEGDVAGAELTLRYHRGLDPTGFRFGAELYGNAAGGTHTFGRAALTLRFGIPLPGPFDAATEYAAGTSLESPLQHNWYVGGANTLRGYPAAQMIGETFWRGRAEVGYGLPALRLVGFSDVAWAGSKDTFSTSRPLLSAGAGISVLDGILRLDVARGLRAPKGWSATLYWDAAL